MNLIRDLKELLLPRLCPVCGKLLMQSEDTLCAYCAIGLPRYRMTNIFDNLMLRMLWDRADIKKATTYLSYNHFSPYHKLIIDIKFHSILHAIERRKVLGNTIFAQQPLSQSILVQDLRVLDVIHISLAVTYDFHPKHLLYALPVFMECTKS